MASSTGIVSFPLGLSVCKDYKFFSAKKVGWCLFFLKKTQNQTKTQTPIMVEEVANRICMPCAARKSPG